MTSAAHPEAESTRALWREYRDSIYRLERITNFMRDDDAENVGRVVRLLREQKRILNELIPEEEP